MHDTKRDTISSYAVTSTHADPDLHEKLIAVLGVLPAVGV